MAHARDAIVHIVHLMKRPKDVKMQFQTIMHVITQVPCRTPKSSIGWKLLAPVRRVCVALRRKQQKCARILQRCQHCCCYHDFGQNIFSRHSSWCSCLAQCALLALISSPMSLVATWKTFVKWFSMIQLFQAFHSLSVPARCPAHKTGWFNGYNGQNFLVQGQLPLQQMMHIEELQFVLWGSLALCLELGLGHWPLNSCTAFARWLQADLGFHCFLCWPLSRGLGFTAMSPRWCLKHCRDCWKAFSVLMTLTNLTPSVPFQKLTCGLIWEMMRQMQTLKTWLKHIRKMHGGMQKVTEDSNGFQGILEQRFPFLVR